MKGEYPPLLSFALDGGGSSVSISSYFFDVEGSYRTQILFDSLVILVGRYVCISCSFQRRENGMWDSNNSFWTNLYNEFFS
jgi:hypothetical protein